MNDKHVIVLQSYKYCKFGNLNFAFSSFLQFPFKIKVLILKKAKISTKFVDQNFIVKFTDPRSTRQNDQCFFDQ